MAGPLCSAKRNAPFFMISICISSNPTMRGNNSSNTGLFCGLWQIHTIALCTSQLATCLGRVRCALVGPLSAMASDSVSAQVRRLSSLSIASCTLLARLVAQLLARCFVVAPPMNVHVTNQLGCDAMCSLSAMQPRHGHSKCSHPGGAERIMATEGGQRAHWRV